LTHAPADDIAVTVRPRHRAWARCLHAARLAVVFAAVLALTALAAPHAAPAASALDAADHGIAPYTHERTWTLPPAATRPLDVALFDGTLLVADGTSHQVLVFDDAGMIVDRWDPPVSNAETTAGGAPLRLAVDHSSGDAYILWRRKFVNPAPGTPLDGMWLERRSLTTAAVRSEVALPFREIGDLAWHDESRHIFVAADGAIHRIDPATGAVTSLSAQYTPFVLVSLAASADRLALVERLAGRPMVLFDLAGRKVGDVDLPSEPVAVARGMGDGFVALLSYPDPTASGSPMLVDVRADGSTSRTTTVGTLDVPALPALDWPWALALQGDRVAMTAAIPASVGTGLRPGHLPAFAWGDRDLALRTMTLADSVGAPHALCCPRPEQPRGTLNIAASDAGLIVLDCSGIRAMPLIGDCGHERSRSILLDRDLRLKGAWPAPSQAVDVALDAAGGVTVITAESRTLGSPTSVRIRAFSEIQRLGPLHAGRPLWSTPCECPGGARAATGPGAVHVARPERREVAAFDLGSGLAVSRATLGEPRGLWPGDVALEPGGVRFTADTGAGRTQRFDALGGPDAVWRGPSGSGPERLAAGPWQHGRPVVVALMTDGRLTMRDASDGVLLARWQPTRPDGGTFRASDVAMRSDGTLFLADPDLRAVHLFRPAVEPDALPRGALPAPTPSTEACSIRGAKDAGPARVVLGATVVVTLSLQADCHSHGTLSSADIVLVISRYNRLGSIPAYAATTARTLLTQVDDSGNRFGAVLVAAAGSDEKSESYPLASDPTAILAAIRGNVTSDNRWYSRIDDAVAMLASTRRPDALPVIVAMLDPAAIDLTVAALAKARDAGIATYLVTERHSAELAGAAGSPDRYLVNPSSSEVLALYRDILRTAGISQAGNVVINDWLGPEVDYVAGSAQPLGLAGDRLLTWGSALIPTDGMTLTYRVVPNHTGRVAIGGATIARYTDFDGSERAIHIPAPVIEVVAPTATLAPDATETPTSQPSSIILPILTRE